MHVKHLVVDLNLQISGFRVIIVLSDHLSFDRNYCGLLLESLNIQTAKMLVLFIIWAFPIMT
jgi:hypothetical protein